MIDQAVGGDPDALSYIYFQLKNSIYGFAFRMTRENSIAEEITQDVFVSFVENPTRYNSDRSTLFLYLCGIARNKVMDYLRKNGTRLEENDFQTDYLENMPRKNGDSPSDKLLREELSVKIEDSVSRLTPLQREVIVLREIEELSYREIAEITHSDTGIVKSRIYRARRALAEELSPYVKGDEVTNYEVHKN